jgi:hypothetical protein
VQVIQSSTAIRVAALGVLAAIVAACGEGGDRRELGAVVTRDSAGIMIIETPGAAARTPIGWTVGEAPELQLGSATSEGPEQFHRIGAMVGGIQEGGITAVSGGRTLVLNGSTAELRFFDREGRFLGMVGGVGDGPGEFRLPVLVPYGSSDSLLLFDTRRRQFTLLSADGQAHRRFPLEGLGPELVVGFVQGASDSGILVTTALGATPMGVGHQWITIGVRWIRLDTIRAEIVAQHRTLTFNTDDLDTRFRIGVSVPFSIRPAAAVGRNGFFVTGGDAAEVQEFDNRGQLRRIFRLSEKPRPVTPEDVESAIGVTATRYNVSPSQARRVYEQMDFPDYWPSFQSIRVDRLGWIWVELFRPPQDSTPRWMVFDSSGVARGTLESPRQLEVHDIGPDYILGRWRDDLGAEYVRRYRLDRLRRTGVD